MRTALASLLTLLVATGLAAEPRTWTDRDGRTVEAELIRADATSVVIRRTDDGREFTLPRERLSTADLSHLDSLPPPGSAGFQPAPPSPATAFASPTPTPTTAAEPPWLAPLNAALGLPLFADANLWDDAPAAAVAARLGPQLRPESITPGHESWRAYLRTPKPLLGAPAYSLSVRAEEGRLAEVAILFTNRGDHAAFAGLDPLSIVPPAALASFRASLADDFEKIRAALAAALPGGAVEPTAAERRATPGNLALFTAGEHRFVLQSLPDWHLALRIQSAERAAPPRLSDDQLRQRLRARVTRRDNADVVINQIPMVDQGPKGYCVPATFERLLRYSGIPADMYDLAAAGGTRFGGGTDIAQIVQALERTVRQHGRRLEVVRLNPSAPALARYIDEGRPVLWAMSSTPSFNALAGAYTKERAAVAADPDALKTFAAERRRLGATLAPEPGAAHLCLLIGYNRVTGELAFSDSWGPDFAERWLPAAAVQAVSSGEVWVLNF
jgi:hypothetical protein